VIPDFVARLQAEFERRRRANPRYSLRAFARFLGIDHSTLSQMLRRARVPHAAHLRDLAARLGVSREEVSAYLAASDLPAPDELAAQLRRLHWLAEADALMQMPVHWQLLALLRDPGWRPDMRWVSARTGAAIDDINQAAARLLRLRLLQIDDAGRWRAAAELEGKDAQAMREMALARIRLAQPDGPSVTTNGMP
jgi:transcriptional regulator with XRE-family HTH domain